MSSALPGFVIRPARDDDADAIIGVIGGCFAEYPGCILAVDEEMPELRAVATAFARRDGRFWVAEMNARVVGCVGIIPGSDSSRQELKNLYVDHAARRRGLGMALCDFVETEARRRNAGILELWSDTRFTDAHRLYRRAGYTPTGRTRDLHDLSHSIEYHFEKPLMPSG